ncbi:MAG: AMP-binding protein, partial [Spirochaetota bacterium]
MYLSLLEIPFKAALDFPDRVSHRWHVKNGTENRTYAETARFIRVLTAGLAEAGVGRGDHVGFFVNNRHEWIATDFALMALGAVSVPRGSDTTPKEVSFIFRHSDSRHLILESVEQLVALLPEMSAGDWERCATIFIVDAGGDADLPGFLRPRTVFYPDLVLRGEAALAREPGLVERLGDSIKGDDLLTIVYT